jgi:hypothetical protein
VGGNGYNTCVRIACMRNVYVGMPRSGSLTNVVSRLWTVGGGLPLHRFHCFCFLKCLACMRTNLVQFKYSLPFFHNYLLLDYFDLTLAQNLSRSGLNQQLVITRQALYHYTNAADEHKRINLIIYQIKNRLTEKFLLYGLAWEQPSNKNTHFNYFQTSSSV